MTNSINNNVKMQKNKNLKMLSILSIAPLMLSMTAVKAQETINSYNPVCSMHEVRAKAAHIARPVTSDHSIIISNTSTETQTFHVVYQNFIMYDMYFSPNAHQEFDVTLKGGESYTHNTPINQDAYFSMRGTYQLLCQTIIKVNNKQVSSFQGKNYAYIE